jgi:hypothetical protein
VRGGPAWLTSPITSCLRILSREEFDDMSAQDVQHILSEQHIYVKPAEDMYHDQGFIPTTLSTLADLDKPIVVHGKHFYIIDLHRKLKDVRLFEKKYVRSRFAAQACRIE